MLKLELGDVFEYQVVTFSSDPELPPDIDQPQSFRRMSPEHWMKQETLLMWCRVGRVEAYCLEVAYQAEALRWWREKNL